MNILESYLVELGFETDTGSFQKFGTVMAEAERLVGEHSSGMTKHILEAQFAITGAFTSVASAIVGVVDKVAMADQHYRLLGLRMFMTTQQARHMEMVTKGLGASLEEIFWDPELRARAGLMLGDITRWEQALGPDFEQKMKRIRDIRGEFQRLSVAVQILAMSFTEKLFDKLHLSDIAAKLHYFVDNLKPEQIDHWADILSDKAVPVLKETWHILEGLGGVAKQSAIAFTNIVGVFSGDESIEGTTFSFEKLLGAVEHVEHGFEHFLNLIVDGEKLLAHFASATSLLFAGKFSDAKNGFASALKEFEDQANQEFHSKGPQSKGILPQSSVDLLNGPGPSFAAASQGAPSDETPGFFQPFLGGEKGAAFRQSHDTHQFDSGRSAITEWLGGALDWLGKVPAATREGVWPSQLKSETSGASVPSAQSPAPWPSAPAVPSSIEQPGSSILRSESDVSRMFGPTSHATPAAGLSRRDIEAAVAQAAVRLNVPPALALAVAEHESGFEQTNPKTGQTLLGPTTRSGEHAMGVMQLMPETAKGLGVDPTDALENIEGGVRYLSWLFNDKYKGDQAKTLAAYSAGPGTVDKTKDFSQLPKETRDYLPAVFGLEQNWLERLDQNETSDVNQRGKQLLGAPANEGAMNQLQRMAPESNVTNSQQHVTVSVGPITVQGGSMTNAADLYRVERTLMAAIREGLSSQIQFDLSQLQPAY